MQIPKTLKEEFGGGTKEFTIKEVSEREEITREEKCIAAQSS
jgi:hypothetical protein